MIIAQLFGGLGNQMFIYAAARRLAVVSDSQLRFDTVSGFAHDPYKRSLALNLFKTDVTPACPGGCALWRARRYQREVLRIACRALPLRMRPYIVEQYAPAFENEFLRLRVCRTTYVEGYWQSENFFRDIAPMIRTEFRLRWELSAADRAEAALIQSTNSVAIGIRRFQEAHALGYRTSPLGISYYLEAMKLVAEREPERTYVFFCEDQEWLRREFPLPKNAHIVTRRSGDAGAAVDMWLFSLCRHHIIANSSFYWWGAWLGEKPGGTVIAPKGRFENVHTIPSRWISLLCPA